MLYICKSNPEQSVLVLQDTTAREGQAWHTRPKLHLFVVCRVDGTDLQQRRSVFQTQLTGQHGLDRRAMHAVSISGPRGQRQHAVAPQWQTHHQLDEPQLLKAKTQKQCISSAIREQL